MKWILRSSLLGLLIALPLSTYGNTVDQADAPESSRFGVFYEPLVAFDKPSPAQRQLLNQAVERYRKGGDPADIKSLRSYLALSPDSPWKASLMFNMGIAKEQAGYYSDAIELLEGAVRAGESADRRSEQVIAERALGELLALHTKFGHREKVAELLKRVDQSPASASITELVAQARSGLWEMDNVPEAVLRCGIVALDTFLAKQGGRDLFSPTLDQFDAGPSGTSLAQLQSIAQTQGTKTRAVHRDPAAAIPVPSVMHLRVGHFATVLDDKKGRYQVFDPAFNKLRWMKKAALEAESSGYFLVEDNSSEWKTVPAQTAAQVMGAGNTSSSQPDQLTTDDVTECDDPCSDSKGMPRYRVHSMLVSLNIIDTPLSYSPPVGPQIGMSLSYIQRAANQPATYTFSNLGPKWTFNWLSYVQDDPQSAGRRVRAYLPGGGSRDYSGYSSGSGAFASEQRTGARLVMTSASPVTYERRMPDGRVYVYGHSDDSTYYPRRIFLTQVIDAHGNAVQLEYDEQQRLTKITDAIGRSSELQYKEPENPLLISGVTDPFGRSTAFEYDDSGRLASITDAVGMTSSFVYDGTFIEKMVTPYGETRFSSGQSGTRRWLVVTDPEGHKERVEYRHSASGIPFSESKVPSGISAFNRYINSRNTFYWDKEAMERAPGDYSKARIRHWFHKRTNTSMTIGVQESIKEPLESRVWFNYPGQNWEGAEGTFDKPSKIARVLPDGSTQLTQKSYNDYGNLTRQVDPEGRELTYEYAENQIDLLRVKRKSSNGYITLASYTYNEQHQPLSYTDANSNKTQYTYNEAGQLTSVTNALGQKTVFSYDSEGYLLSVTDPNNVVVAKYSHDNVGRVQSYTDANNYTLSYQYDGLDRLTKVTYPDGTSESVEWDRLDRHSYTDRYGQVTTYAHDAVRNLVKVVNPSGHQNQFGYFANGLRSGATDGEGNVTAFTRDIQGRLTQTLRPDQKTLNRSFDSSGRLESETNAADGITRYGYAHDNQLQSVTAPNSASTTYQYDAYTGLLIERQSPDSGETAYSYDDAGNLVSKTDGDGLTTTYEYDALNRISQVVYEDGQSVEYIYDTAVNGIGRVASIRDSSGTTYFTYDQAGRVAARRHVSTDGVELSMSYQYTPSGKLSRLTYPSGAVAEYHYDRDRLESVSVNGQTLLGGVEYAPFGPISGWAWGNGLSMNRAFDNNGRISNLKTATNESRNFEYDALGNIVSILGNDEQHFEYDAENRLKVALSSDFSLGYDYDANGNRTWETVDGAENELTYSPESNVLKTVGGIAYSYDGRGNTVNDGEHTYQYDARNRLVSVDGGDTAEYGYNAMGARAFKRSQETYQISADLNQDGRKSVADLLTLLEIIHHRESPVRADLNQDGKVNHRDISCMATHLTHNWFLERFLHCRFGQQIEREAKTRFVYDSANLMGEYDDQGNARQEFVWAGSKPVGLLEDGELYYVSSNQIDAPVAITDQSGELVWQWEPRPFGDSLPDMDVDRDGRDLKFSLRFPGQYRDEETGLNYNFYRNYDSVLGRYIQNDPIGLNGGVNTYGYVGQNPLVFSDPSGLAARGAAVGGAIGGVIGGALGGLAGGAGGTVVAPGVGTVGGGYAGASSGAAWGLAAGAAVGSIIEDVMSMWGDDDDFYADPYGGYDPVDEGDALDLADNPAGASCAAIQEAIVALQNRIRGREQNAAEHCGGDAGHRQRIQRLKDALRKLEQALSACQ
ncbi:hypothetical protein EZI54_20690 [Marinobacter halodurans]|uniref:Peptidase C39 domain-containing protein n=1 Tax=Marinobacter halodurans TaxID=2528979 RepID=A0ABY1ZGU8_9GAMM|nr:RHS repeat-associated core domain-containing protein [Marinobacter halodurans]TBW48869.1 hypothetical protein EZI54_20690 [Marinobacter halodurans]